MEWTKLHTKACLASSAFSQSAKALHQSIASKSNEETGTSTPSLDEMLTDLSKTSIIISPPLIGKKKFQLIIKEKQYSLFILRQMSIAGRDHDDDSKNDKSLLNKLASLSISSGTNTDAIIGPNQTKPDEIINAASQIIANGIIIKYTNTTVTMTKSEAASSAANSAKTATATSTTGYKAFSLSKRILTKASSVVTSIMASYDLAEDQNLYRSTTDDGYGYDDHDHDEDDANLYNDDILDTDDAGHYQDDSRISSSSKIGNEKSSGMNQDMVMNDDVIWSVEIFISCWRAMLDHAQNLICRKQEDGDDDNLTTLEFTDESSPGAARNATGLILERFGDGPLSFLTFCREVGADVESRSEIDAEHVAVARVLQKIASEMPLEILCSVLLMTNKARLSSDEGIMIIYPSAAMSITTELASVQKVNEVDIAIFKISTLIKRLERRVEKLGKQAEEAHKKAYEAKKAGNTKVALLHLKRRQVYLKEIDNCSSSLLNLDGGFHSIKRAKNDAEVLKTYSLMNNSMKAIRQESSIEDVDDVLNELSEYTEDLNAIHETMFYDNKGVHFSSDELEQELAALMDNDNIEVGNEKEDLAKGLTKASDEEDNKVNLKEKKDKQVVLSV